MKLWKAAILGVAVATGGDECVQPADIDMFILHDLSSTFAVDRLQVLNQMPDVISSLQDSFNNVRFGFGSFVDKPMDPFGTPGDYCYQCDQPLTEDLFAYLFALRDIRVRSEHTRFQSQLWSILAAATDPSVLWSGNPNSPVMRLLVVATDTWYHQHPDGQNMSPTHGFLNHTGGFDADCLTHDYPSADQVAQALLAHGTRFIFLPSSLREGGYRNLLDNLVAYGIEGVVAPIAEDSTDFGETLLASIGHLACPDTTPTPNPTDAPGNCVFDIAHVVDNSYSYHASYDMMKQEMGLLATHLQTWHPDSRIGISSFVDKPMAPFGYEDYDYCYDFHHALDLDVDAIVNAYDNIHRKSGFDYRENQLDGTIKTLLDDRMGWRQNSSEGNLINIVLITTDAWYHELGDWPEGAPPTVSFDSDCMVEDYPSVDQLALAMLQKNAAAIFMVPALWRWVYEDVVDQLAALGVDATVVALNPDFRNFNEEAEAGLRTLAQQCLLHLP